jgi:hypothetical protein
LESGPYTYKRFVKHFMLWDVLDKRKNWKQSVLTGDVTVLTGDVTLDVTVTFLERS